jgi:acyl phosphate:glycerol-3-phosphate acyltransferase
MPYWVRPAMIALAYLLGSIPFALLLVKAAGGGDVREVGSGNVGATNATRAAGPLIGIAVAVLDVAKAVLAVILMGLVTASPEWRAAAGLAAIIGHCFPVWLRFAGGKGIATAAGTFLVLAWLPALLAAGVFVIVVAVSRRVSVGSVVAVALFPVILSVVASPKPAVAICAVLACAVIIVRHSGNVRRLIAGTEPRLGEKKP